MANIDEYSIDYRNCDHNTINYSKFNSKLTEPEEYDEYKQIQANNKQKKQEYPKLNIVQEQDVLKEAYLAKCLFGAFLLIGVFITVSIVSTCIFEHISYIANIDVFDMCDNISDFI